MADNIHQLSASTDAIIVVTPQNITGTVVGAAVDTQGWDGVEFILTGGVATTQGVNMYAIQSANSNLSGNTNINYANAVIASVNIAQANVNANVGVLDIQRPSSRYVSVTVVGGAGGQLVSVAAIRYRKTGILPPVSPAAIQTVFVQVN